MCARAFAALARCDAPLLPPLLAAEHDVDRDTEIDEDPFVQECAAEEGAPGRLDQTPLASHDRAVHPPAGSPAEMSRARAAPRSTSVCCHLLCIDADTPPGGSGPGQTIAPVLSASQKRLGMLGRRPRHAPVLPALARMEGPYRLRLHATPSPLCPLTRTCIRLLKFCTLLHFFGPRLPSSSLLCPWNVLAAGRGNISREYCGCRRSPPSACNKPWNASTA